MGEVGEEIGQGSLDLGGGGSDSDGLHDEVASE